MKLSKKDMNRLASKIAKREGKKSQVKIGDIREVLRILFEIANEEKAAYGALIFANIDAYSLCYHEKPKAKK
jgi:hypothetical protein